MATIEQYFKSRIPSVELSTTDIEMLCESPIEVGLEALESDDDAFQSDAEFLVRRNYAESNLWYMAVGLLNGGSVTEKIGDESYTRSGYTLSDADKDRFMAMGDMLREKAGYPPLTDDVDMGEVSDGAQYVGLIIR